MSTLDALLGGKGYTTVAAAYTQPALGGSVVVTLVNTAWLPIGEHVLIEGAGVYLVTAKDLTTATLQPVTLTIAAGAGVSASRIVLVVASGSRQIGVHDLTYSPIILSQLNGALTDSSGNGLTLGGTPNYSPIFPGVLGLALRGATNVTVTSDLLALTGDMTIEAIVQLDWAAVSQDVIKYAGGSNQAYSLSLAAPGLKYTSQHGGGHTVATYTESTNMIAKGQLCHLAMTRASNMIQFYVDGVPAGALSGPITAPDTVTGGSLQVGDANTSGIIASLKIIGSALTADQIKGEYNRTLGAWFGTI